MNTCLTLSKVLVTIAEIVKSVFEPFSRISSASEDDVVETFSPVLKEPTTLISSITVLFALWIKPVAPDVTPVTFAPTVLPADGIPDIVSLVIIRISKR